MSKVSEKAVLHLPEKSCSKSIVFSIIPPLSGEPSLFVFFQSIVRSIIEYKGINYNHVIIFSHISGVLMTDKRQNMPGLLLSLVSYASINFSGAHAPPGNHGAFAQMSVPGVGH